MSKAIVKHKRAGRPTVFTKKAVALLVQAFKYGCNDSTACQYAKVSREAYYDHLKKNEDFATIIMQAQNYPRLLAGQVVIQSMTKKGDVMSARWWLEKKHADEFGGAPPIQNNTLNIFSFTDEQKDTFNTQFRDFLRRRQYA